MRKLGLVAISGGDQSRPDGAVFTDGIRGRFLAGRQSIFSVRGRLTLWRPARQAYIAPQRFLSREGPFLFLW